MKLLYQIEGGDFVNAGKASSAVKSVLKQLDVQSSRIKRTVIALYEAEVNVVAHADRGEIEALVQEDKITVTIRDSGPGIEDLDRAMQEGFSTASPKVREMGFGAGMGLPNIRRNCDQLQIDSVAGEGTMLRFTNSLKA
jgi:anti-sigma regulatory factor (Ser/Thr protein kinase)